MVRQFSNIAETSRHGKRMASSVGHFEVPFNLPEFDRYPTATWKCSLHILFNDESQNIGRAMVDSLKRKNRPKLYTVLAGNLILFYGALKTPDFITGNWMAAIQDLVQALPAGLGITLTGILNAQLSADTKSRIVFLRFRNPLPGCEAFTRHARSDSRIDFEALEKHHGPLPNDPKAQNTLWYKLYKTVEAEPAVSQAHQAFLFARDYTCIALVMLFVLGGAAIFQTMPMKVRLVYLVLLFLQFVIAGQAARNHGRRFVSTVLAIKGTK